MDYCRLLSRFLCVEIDDGGKISAHVVSDEPDVAAMAPRLKSKTERVLGEIARRICPRHAATVDELSARAAKAAADLNAKEAT